MILLPTSIECSMCVNVYLYFMTSVREFQCFQCQGTCCYAEIVNDLMLGSGFVGV